ncbi:hypothetical protein G210_4600 [Candida maltosa Xu316]|uniref:Serine protease n=1 Tax=Candida maltosa (strain Xu316) TaxID=1245528 RepID=M3JDS0_CANMX|nr:hypothetical protein G210_4600 [Candida maltosa Xu316]
MSFQYKPVALRYQTKSEVYASSGIHIFTNNDDFILTINHIPKISNYQILINEFDNQDDDVYWRVGVLEREIVTDGIKFGDVSGFDLFPADSFSRHRDGISLLMIKLKEKKVERKGLEELRVGDNRNVKEVKILSYPFNLTNSLIFKDFVSQGYITNRVRPGWYLSDIRYVENMNGGVVLNADNGNVVGLVYGNLRKRNGDGDLLLIIDIHVILKHINISPIPQPQITPPPTPEPQQNIDNNLQNQKKSVIPLVTTSLSQSPTSTSRSSSSMTNSTSMENRRYHWDEAQ